MLPAAWARPATAGDEAQRTKAAVYRTHTFFTVYGARMGDPAPTDLGESLLKMDRISGFVLPQGLVTVRLSPCVDVDEVSARFDEAGGQEYGVGALVHGLLDVVVDGHFAAVQALDDGIEDIESALFENNTPAHDLQRRTPGHGHHRARDASVAAGRAAQHDHMKKLTGWAAIIAVPTAITGFYGQNVPFPGFSSAAGFFTSTAMIVIAVALLFWTFRTREWL